MNQIHSPWTSSLSLLDSSTPTSSTTTTTTTITTITKILLVSSFYFLPTLNISFLSLDPSTMTSKATVMQTTPTTTHPHVRTTTTTTTLTPRNRKNPQFLRESLRGNSFSSEDRAQKNNVGSSSHRLLCGSLLPHHWTWSISTSANNKISIGEEGACKGPSLSLS